MIICFEKCVTRKFYSWLNIAGNSHKHEIQWAAGDTNSAIPYHLICQIKANKDIKSESGGEK